MPAALREQAETEVAGQLQARNLSSPTASRLRRLSIALEKRERA